MQYRTHIFLAVSALLLCSVCTQVLAQKLYQYQAEKGRWQYTDKKPSNDTSFEKKQLKASQKQRVWLENSNNQSSPEYMIRNNYSGPIEVAFRFISQHNVTASPSLPRRFTIQEGLSPILFQVSATDPTDDSKFKFEYSYTVGDPQASHNPDSSYIPPLPPNEQFEISQSFDGPFTHQGEQNKYAVDIAMPVNTPVHAARSGIVMEVESDFFNSGTKQAYKSRANSIRVLHEDGSMAVYAHLALEKLVVHPGLAVTAGQLIGYSGNTGYTTGPHLHFSVQLNKGMRLSSVPFKFTGPSGQTSTPQAGGILRGKVKF
jgi:murein DD-endopeptidase MepM/ murein hydrolase activator NlpD